MSAPAPWRKEHRTGWIMPYIILDDNGYHVASCNDEANANAIAAVPDMVAALQKINDWDPASAPDEPGGMSIMDAISLAHAALEKAGVKP